MISDFISYDPCPPNIQERDDCAVRAFTALCLRRYGRSYTSMRQLFRRHGSPYGKPTDWKTTKAVSKALGLRLTLIRRGGTVGRFLREFPQGHYLVRYSGHLFAVLEGSVCDAVPVKPTRRVTHAWLVTKESK